MNRDILRTFTEAIYDLLKAEKLTAAEHQKSIDAVLKQSRDVDREYFILTRQRKFIEEDLDELVQLQDHGVGDLMATYRSLLAPKLDSTIYHQRKNCDDDIAFRRRVTKYYNAYRGKDDEEDEVWRHLGGSWQSGRFLRTVHIVPKQLRSEQLSYIFGVRDADLDDVRNGEYYSFFLQISLLRYVVLNNETGITLESLYADALNAGEIVFVPVPQGSGKRLEWKCVVLNRRAVNAEMENDDNEWKVSPESCNGIISCSFQVLIAATRPSTGGP